MLSGSNGGRPMQRLEENAFDPALLSQALELTRVGTWVWDAASDTVQWSDQLFRLMGLEPHSIPLQKDTYLAFVVPEDRERVSEIVEAALPAGSEFRFETRIVTAQGTLVHHLSRGNVVRNATGRVISILGTCIEVPDRGLHQAASRTSERELLQTIMDNVPVTVSMFDQAARPIYVNREWVKAFGWTLQEAQVLDLMSMMYPDPEEAERARDSMKIGSLEWMDFNPVARNGVRIPTSWACICLSDGTTLTIGQDMTERNRSRSARAPGSDSR